MSNPGKDVRFETTHNSSGIGSYIRFASIRLGKAIEFAQFSPCQKLFPLVGRELTNRFGVVRITDQDKVAAPGHSNALTAIAETRYFPAEIPRSRGICRHLCPFRAMKENVRRILLLLAEIGFPEVIQAL
jgi:hypothetical protein